MRSFGNPDCLGLVERVDEHGQGREFIVEHLSVLMGFLGRYIAGVEQNRRLDNAVPKRSELVGDQTDILPRSTDKQGIAQWFKGGHASRGRRKKGFVQHSEDRVVESRPVHCLQKSILPAVACVGLDGQSFLENKKIRQSFFLSQNISLQGGIE
jgi:hypothetical protein